MASDEELLLAFKESGVEFVEDAAKAVGELGDKMDSVNQAQAAAIEILKEEGTVVEDLEAKISKLKAELEALADAHKAGLIAQDKYKEQTDALVKVIAENETVLKRLTASQREAEKAEAEATKAAEAEIAARLKAFQQEEAEKSRIAKQAAKDAEEEAAALAKITAALNALEAEEDKEQLAAIALAEKHYQTMMAAEAAAGTGSGEAGKGGFAGLAANVIKAEKVMSGLASGSGFGRMGGMLESITSALGMAGGAGLAAGGLIFAFEALIPKIEKFIEKMDGAAESAKHVAEMTKAAYEQMQKLKEQPDEEEETSAKAIKGVLSGKKGMQIATGIEESLLAEDYGLNEYQKKSLAMPGNEYEKDIIREGQRSAIITRGMRMMKEMEAGHQATISDVEGMAMRHEDLFPAGTEQHLRQALPENIEAAKKQSQKAEADSEWADTTYAKREEARKENVGIQDEFDKALKDKKKHAAAEYDAAMKFAADMKVDLDNKAIAAEKHAATQAEHAATKAKAAADKHEREREKWDREHTPEHLTQQEAKADAAAVMDMEREQNQYRADMGAMPFDARELEAIKHKALQAMPFYKARGFSLGQLVADMMAMQANQIEQGMSEGLDHHGRSGQLINPKGGH